MGCKGSPELVRKVFYVTGNNEQWRGKSDTADKTTTDRDLLWRQVPRPTQFDIACACPAVYITPSITPNAFRLNCFHF
jgi:hypothetical protein